MRRRGHGEAERSATSGVLPGDGRAAPASAPDLRALGRGGTVHFMGVAGAGMSVLAEWLLRAGGSVSGCDLAPGRVGEALRQRGAEIREGHSPDHLAGAVAVVFTAAVPADHAELVAAREMGLPLLKRAEALGAIVNTGRLVAVAGTHGKTTTAAMTTAVLEEAGLEPTGFVGGHVKAWDSGLRQGADRLFVVEADEYDRSFLSLRPEIAVVTTLEADHLDQYGSLAAVEAAFRQFLEPVPAAGLVIACTDDAGAHRLLEEPGPGRRLGYGTGPAAALRAVDVALRGRESSFRVELDGRALGDMLLPVPGLHNVRNALAATAVGLHLGVDFDVIRRALSGFRGVHRRFEGVGEVGGALVVDDYAHHPTELRATLQAARTAYPGRRIVAVFQPHLYSRTRDFCVEFGRALAGADVVWVTDVFAARERPIPGVSGESVARAAEQAGARQVHYHEGALDALVPVLAAELRSGDVCLTLGAGDVDRVGRGLVALRSAPGAAAGSLPGWQSGVLLGQRVRYRVGGPARALAEASDLSALRLALDSLGGGAYLVLGSGANLVVSDEGVAEPILSLEGEFRRIEVGADAIVAGAGAALPAVVQAARRGGRRGWELLEAIPGTVGGALWMNAGTAAWGVWSLVEWAEVLLPGVREPARVTAAEAQPTYRRVGLPSGTILLRARFVAPSGAAALVGREHMDQRAKKMRTQPYDKPSCGSVWMNPPGRSAWQLVEAFGLKGERVGGARISEKHGNFIVNEGGATAADIIALMLLTRRRVRDASGIELCPEVRLWGFAPELLVELGAGGQVGGQVGGGAR